MELRESREADLPEIIKVLRASLGEADLPISEEIWKYKHVKNPFGRSLVLVAQEDNKIVGVRALMKWCWQADLNKFDALRAVDTATHPDYQGKGIFKKLTLNAIGVAETSPNSFVFNTPNDQSRPGYLKMGWEKAGSLKVALRPAFNSLWKFSSIEPQYLNNNGLEEKDIQNLCDHWNYRLERTKKAFTPKSPEFLKWRYEQNPLQKYEIDATPNYYIAAYVKKRKYFNELRIAELIYKENLEVKELRKKINQLSGKFPVQVISYSPQIFYSHTLAMKGDFGPILTVKDLNLSPKHFEYLKTVNNWGYSLGDLELF